MLSILVVAPVFLFLILGWNHNTFSQDNGNDWRLIGTSAGGEKIHISPSRTVRKRTGLSRGWFKVIMPETEEKTSEMVALLQFNCAEGKMRILQVTAYRRSGKEDSTNSPTEWEYPPPHSAGEIEFRTICRPIKSK